MAYPFPGMNPYLERPSLWPDVHLEFIRAIRLELTRAVAPRYYVAAEERMYIAAVDPATFIGRPDVAVVGDPLATASPPASAPANGGPVPVTLPLSAEMRERYLEIRESGSDRVITVIEIPSPANKVAGAGRSAYAEKRSTVLDSATCLVEIDLLRLGEPLPAGSLPASSYRILVSRGWERPRGYVYPFDLTDPIPAIPIPLQAGEEEPRLDLGAQLPHLYDDVRYDLRIDYTVPPPAPPLSDRDAAWLDGHLRAVGLRA